MISDSDTISANAKVRRLDICFSSRFGMEMYDADAIPLFTSIINLCARWRKRIGLKNAMRPLWRKQRPQIQAGCPNNLAQLLVLRITDNLHRIEPV